MGRAKDLVDGLEALKAIGDEAETSPEVRQQAKDVASRLIDLIKKIGSSNESLDTKKWDIENTERTWDIYLKGEKLKRFKASMKLPPDRVKDILVKKYNFDPNIELKIYTSEPVIMR